MISLQQTFLFGFFLNFFSAAIRALQLDGDKLLIHIGKNLISVSLGDITNPPDLKCGLFGTSLTISCTGQRPIVIRGTRYSEAKKFSDATKDAWIKFNLDILEKESAKLERIHSAISDLAQPSRYPAACLLQPILDDARSLETTLLSKLQFAALSPEITERINRVREFVADPHTARENAISLFEEAEIDRQRNFFDTVENNPLTPEQRRSIVADEDATLVLAGAGSGKTSVITAKAAYLVKSGIRKPEEILLLSYAKQAAAEMSERIEEHTKIPVTAQTFHALGNHIISTVEKTKPALAPHATRDGAIHDLIKQILTDLVHVLSEVSQTVVTWFAQFFLEPNKTEWDFQTKHEYYTYMKQQELLTLRNERVKSYEELQIANHLHINGIAYEYEPVYKHNVSETGRRVYQPDFRLTESGIYIEHFGVRIEKLPDGGERLVTAPFVDREKYLEDMEWKRGIHKQYQTTLIETYSHERQKGILLTNLAKKLASHVTPNPLPADTIYDRFIESKQIDKFSNLLGTFLQKYKGGGYNPTDCKNKAVAMRLGKRAEAFLSVFHPVHAEYEKRLAGKIDFEDMILEATKHVKSGRYQSPFRHILIDEFQDISQSRARLVKALQAQHPDTRIFAVGDDWQSIYRFNGSDIHFMSHFGAEFGGTFDGKSGIHRSVDLGRTFRSVDQIAFAARDFVLKNPHQIEKNIIPESTTSDPAITIVVTQKNKESEHLTDAISSITSKTDGIERKERVLLLGRYKRLMPNMKFLQSKFSQFNIDFNTIHKSKGGEADHVILLDAKSGRSGFPSEKEDDILLSLVSPEREIFEHAEERRLMYVAMTRARHTLTILASKSRPSSFVTELIRNLNHDTIRVIGDELDTYKCGECGGRLLGWHGKSNNRIRYYCEHDRYCINSLPKYSLPACSACGTRMPQRISKTSEAHCRCGATYPPCLECTDGWLVERNGKYGKFLSCARPSCQFTKNL